MAQPALGIERGRTAAGRSGDCLAVSAVDQVAGSEYALRGGTGRIAFGQDVATGIQVYESGQATRARRLTDSDEDSRNRDSGIAGMAHVANAQPPDVLATVYG